MPVLYILMAIHDYFPFLEMENEINHMYKIVLFKEKKYTTTLQKKNAAFQNKYPIM